MARKKKETLENKVKENTKKVLDLVKEIKEEEKFLTQEEIYELMKLTNAINTFKLQSQVLNMQIEKERAILNAQKIQMQAQLKDRENQINKLQADFDNFKKSNNEGEKYRSYVDKLKKKYKLTDHWAYDELTGLIKEEQFKEEIPQDSEKN